jgi:hypothetical protein
MSKKRGRKLNLSGDSNSKKSKNQKRSSPNNSSQSSQSSLNSGEMSFQEYINSTAINEDNMLKNNHADSIDSIRNTIGGLKAKNNPSNKDIVNGIAQVVELLCETLLDIQAMKNQLFSTTKKTIENSVAIEELKEKVAIQNKMILDNRARVCYYEQRDIDSEIFMSIFPTRPNEDDVIEKFCSNYDVPVDSIRDYYSYSPNLAKGKNSKFYMVVSFRSKTDQLTARRMIKEKGPFHYDGSGSNGPLVSNHIIKISSRYTYINRKVLGELRALKDAKKISDIRYRNCSFQMKLNGSNDFISVPTLEHIHMNLPIIEDKE